MDVIGVVEVRIIEGNCVDRRKPWREVNAKKRRLEKGKRMILTVQ